MDPDNTDHTDSQASAWPENDGHASEPVLRLIYASVSRLQGPVLSEMRRIRDQAARRNAPEGVRVALLHKAGWFVQWAEGPESAIERLIERVSADSRHHGLLVLHRSVGRRRLFKPWIGALVQGDDVPSVMASRVRRLARSQQLHPSREPAQLWALLCAPPQWDMPRPGGARLRVMLLSARGRQAFDLLRWLSERYRRPLVARRFAASADDVPDVASDYLDLPADEVPGGLRLIAQARQSLSMGVAHAFLPDHAAIVLWLDGADEHNRLLTERLLSVCDQVQHRPAIVGLGAPQAWQSGLSEQVQAMGHLWLEAPVEPGTVSAAHHWSSLAPVLTRLATAAPPG